MGIEPTTYCLQSNIAKALGHGLPDAVLTGLEPATSGETDRCATN